MKEGLKKFGIKISYILFALVLSAALWMFVEITENELQERTILVSDIIFKNEDLLESRGLLISQVLPDLFEITFEGPMREISNLLSGEVFIEVDLETIRTTGPAYLDFIEILPDNVNTNNISITDRTTSQIYLNIDRLSTREFNVEVRYTGGTVSEDYTAGQPEIEPGRIEISGPEEKISQIAGVLVPITEDNLSTTFTGEFGYILVDEFDNEIDLSLPEFETLRFSHDEIRVTIPIRQLRALPLQVEIYHGDSRTTSEANTSWYVEPMEITVSGDPEVFRDLEINSITIGMIDTATFALNTSRMFSIRVPEGLTNVSGETTATVMVEVRDVISEVRSVSNIQPINTPPGYIANIITQSLDVRLRGTAENLALVRPEHIWVNADLTDYSPGGSSITPSISIVGIDVDVDVVYRRDNVEYILTVTITEDDRELNG